MVKVETLQVSVLIQDSMHTAVIHLSAVLHLTSSSTLANTNVKPESQKELEFGIDLGFFNSSLSIQTNIYTKKVEDLLINRFIAPTTGFSSLLDNFGSLENKGFEFVVTGKPIQNKN